MKKIKKWTPAATLAGIAALALTATHEVSRADTRVELGVLRCDVEGGTGFVFGSTKNLSCVFDRDGADEVYVGKIEKFGLDIGTTTDTQIAWAVLGASSDVPPGALAGSYGGVSAEATAGAGIGANALVGGSSDSVVLQPLSVQAQTGLNLAVAISSLTLNLAN